MAYPLGWSVIPQLIVRRERWQPGEDRERVVPLVQAGQEVLPDQPVLRLHVEPLDGRAQGVSSSMQTADETLPAGLHGRVLSITPRGGVVLESRAALIQGILGAGKPVVGVITIWQAGGAGGGSTMIPPGAILIVPGPLNFALLSQAARSGVTGIVASSIALRDLEGFLRTDLLQLLDTRNVERTHAQLPPVTLMFTEGLGTAAMSASALNLLNRYQGSIGLLSGLTSVQQGIFPELVISLGLEEAQKHWQPIVPDARLVVGSQVRIRGGAHVSTTGTIDHFFVYEQRFPSGIRARAVRVRREDGSLSTVPLALLERIG